MKNLIIITIIVLSFIMASCGPQEEYMGQEVAAFVAGDEAAFTEEKLSCYNSVAESFVLEPFALLNGCVYYPGYDIDGFLYYRLARR